MTARIRVVKLIVQPVVVLDDGEHLSELHADPMTVRPGDLETFPERFAAELARQQEQLDGGDDPREQP